ncbi:hypothetical protein GALL_535330 [mine drainage metagenome]|uniref:Uncharacterized protein n=1 Tax=mine drainage metagenome TaxID=410659 RepID=A0A1J5P041_9ZZZZ
MAGARNRNRAVFIGAPASGHSTSINETTCPDGTLGPAHAAPAATPISNARTTPRIHAPYNGMLSCFFQGLLSFLPRSDAKARATRRRVECGMITSSMNPFSAATNGLAKRSS